VTVNVANRSIKQVKSDWTEVVLVCRKCSKKLRGGFGIDGDQPFSKALRRELQPKELKAKGRRARIGIVEVGCFDVCPKNAVVAVRAASPGEWLVIPAGTPAAEAAARLRVGGSSA
jgi:predicted metal-binding protein